MILTCNGISKVFGENEVLSDINFLLNENEKAAIIGVNGCGKTTLFKIITGELSPTTGSIIMPKDIQTGYFSQDITIESENTLYGELSAVFSHIYELEKTKQALEEQMKHTKGSELTRLMRKYDNVCAEFARQNGFECESRIKGVIKGLGFSLEDSQRKINTLSGGQKTRCALGKLLLINPDILMLDEPTNHLDINSIKWLENYLSAYKGTVIVISHDRYFIDKVTNKIIEIENGTSKVYNGNYSFYAAQKEKDRENAMHRYINQQKEIKKQEEAIAKLKSFNREKSVKRAESKEKALEKTEVIAAPEPVADKMRFSITPAKESGKDVLNITNLTKAYGSNRLFTNINLEIKKGEKIALIGANGTGKTTIFKIITGLTKADSGAVKTGSNVEIGYYDQEHNNLDFGKTIFDMLSDEYPTLTETQIRSHLAAFLFKGDDIYKPVSLLSGGEKGRVSLAMLMLSKANLLLLDEPTNHLDIYSKEILENALKSYKGTLLFISHDRYFINKTAEKIIELTENGIKTYLGNYDYYLEKKPEAAAGEVLTAQQKSPSLNKLDWQKQKEELAEKRKAEARLKRLEAKIEEIEEEIEQTDALLETDEVATNPLKAAKIYNKKTELEEELLALYEQLEQ